jgi:hypothetical protein
MKEDLLRSTYPSLTSGELKEAEENLSAYFAIAVQIALETQDDNLDRPIEQVTMNERSDSSLENTSYEHG